MLRSSINYLDTSTVEWQIAHLFEHMLIRAFVDRLYQAGINANMILWHRGETFENALFLDFGFYTEQLQSEFDAFLQDIPAFTDADIDFSLASIATEDKVLITVADRAALKVKIDSLRKQKWNMPAASDSKPVRKLLVEKKSAKSYRDITIGTNGINLTAEEQKVFLRLRILFMDFVTEGLKDVAGRYNRGHSDCQLYDGDNIGFLTINTVPKSISLKAMRDELHTLESFDIQKQVPNVLLHFETFKHEPIWQGASIEYYRWTGIVTSNQEIAELATPERIVSIFSKLFFEVSATTPTDRKYVDEA